MHFVNRFRFFPSPDNCRCNFSTQHWHTDQRRQEPQMPNFYCTECGRIERKAIWRTSLNRFLCLRFADSAVAWRFADWIERKKCFCRAVRLCGFERSLTGWSRDGTVLDTVPATWLYSVRARRIRRSASTIGDTNSNNKSASRAASSNSIRSEFACLSLVVVRLDLPIFFFIRTWYFAQRKYGQSGSDHTETRAHAHAQPAPAFDCDSSPPPKMSALIVAEWCKWMSRTRRNIGCESYRALGRLSGQLIPTQLNRSITKLSVIGWYGAPKYPWSKVLSGFGDVCGINRLRPIK